MKVQQLSKEDSWDIILSYAKDDKTGTIVFGDVMWFLDYISIYENDTIFVRQIAANLLKNMRTRKNISIADK